MAMTEADKIAKYGPILAYCNSKTQPDKVYEVRGKNGPSGELSCNCTGYIFSKARPKTCRHCDYLRSENKGEVPSVKTVQKPKVRQAVVPIAPEISLVEEMLATAGLTDIIKSALGLSVMKEKIKTMAAVLKPHLTALAQPIMPSEPLEDDGVRLITFDC